MGPAVSAPARSEDDGWPHYRPWKEGQGSKHSILAVSLFTQKGRWGAAWVPTGLSGVLQLLTSAKRYWGSGASAPAGDRRSWPPGLQEGPALGSLLDPGALGAGPGGEHVAGLEGP